MRLVGLGRHELVEIIVTWLRSLGATHTHKLMMSHLVLTLVDSHKSIVLIIVTHHVFSIDILALNSSMILRIHHMLILEIELHLWILTWVVNHMRTHSLMLENLILNVVRDLIIRANSAIHAVGHESSEVELTI
jgi:hypothetical protein